MSRIYQLFTALLVGVGMGSGLTTAMNLTQPSTCQIAAQKVCDPDGSLKVSDPAGNQRCIGEQMLRCACD
ncbi:hypothetical protein MK489_16815 [Myxococcota bacterium]|nr:hypothetical protein [Myxococcota bacterium]